MLSSDGFSLVELVVALAILGALIATGVPAFRTYSLNSLIATEAQGFLNGLQAARAAAVRINGSAELTMVSSLPTAALVGAPTISATGPNWLVRSNNGDGTFTFVSGHQPGESSASGAAQTAINTGGVEQFIYQADGRIPLLNAPMVVNFTPAGGVCEAPTRCLGVRVSPGGNARVCDPSISIVGDTRTC